MFVFLCVFTPFRKDGNSFYNVVVVLLDTITWYFSVQQIDWKQKYIASATTALSFIL